MIKPEQIPEDVWVQVALCLEEAGCMVDNDIAKKFAAQVINSWPRIMEQMRYPIMPKGEPQLYAIILPLTEKPDDR